MATSSQPWFVRKDLDGFFGLMIDNLIQLILIVSLCRELIHLPDTYIFGRILPGAAISILVGNFFYAWQARQLARATGREDVTALPYGINTVSLFAYVFFIMLPIYETYLSFNTEMIALILAFNVILDPLVTSCNVMANGALARVFDNLWIRLQPKSKVTETSWKAQ